ncbi:MAG: ABC transporter ATP-binding protein [Bdellovibrionales bacterium]|nr:ABC transporter ATP-binding protein [Bdellovibrionales bacterium]
MLDLQNVSVNYGPIRALKNISLRVDAGEIVALIGCNGAGKTTTLRAISGLLRPASGQVQFDGKDITREKPHEVVRRGLCHVPERRGIFANLTVLENLIVGAYTRKVTQQAFDEVYALFPILKERTKQIAGTLSGGEQQMLAISRALLAKPRLMLLDEPSLGLAPQITQSIFNTIRTINKSGTTVMLVEQNANAALKIADRAYVLEVGETVLSGSGAELLNNDEVRRAYLGE